MAWDTPKSGKATVFPSKLKTFVRDVANLKRTASGHSLARSVASVATESERAWSIASDFDCPEEQPEHRAGISVQLVLTFENPLEFSCNRCYNSSADFKPTERLLRGLIRRIDHGSFELVTRKDPNATMATRGEGLLKPKRFEMTYQISQKGTIWATRTYTSYQKDTMTAASVKEVVLSSHRLIGLFLRRHDPDFVWRDGPIRDELPDGPEVSTYRVGGTQAMNCIPRSRFLEQTQAFEAIPGFKLEIIISSRSQRRKPPEWQKILEVESKQTTPLNLSVAEALFSNASYTLEAALRLKRKTIEERHRRLCGSISASCQHYEEDATNVSLRVTNNLGPQFDHLQRTIVSKLALLGNAEAKDVVDLIHNLESALEDARDAADHIISGTNDFEFRIVELRGRGWTLDEPLVFTLGSSDSYSRRSVQAILDRVQAGVADVLKGNAATVRMSATKRGHYILDKTLLAPRDPKAEAGRWSVPSKNKTKVVDKLRRRIHQDIDMICKDTCSLDNLDDKEPAAIKDLPTKVDVFGQAEFEATKLPLPTTPSPKPTAVLQQAHEVHTMSPVVPNKQQVLETPPVEPRDTQTPAHEFSERRKPRSAAYLRSGVRVFPLVSTISSYGFTEGIATTSSPQDVQLPRDCDSVESPIIQEESHNATPNGKDEAASIVSATTVQSLDANQDPSTASNPVMQEVGPEFRARRLSTSTQERHRNSDGEDASLAPSTPSLMFGSSHSATSSLYLYTPQTGVTASGAEVKILPAAGPPGSRDGEHEPHATDEAQHHPKFEQSSPVESSSPRFANFTKHKPMPSPLQHHNRASDEDMPSTKKILRDGPFSDSESGHANVIRDPQEIEVGSREDIADESSRIAEAAEILEDPENNTPIHAAENLQAGQSPKEVNQNLVSNDESYAPPLSSGDREGDDHVDNIGVLGSHGDVHQQIVAIPLEIASAEEVRTPTGPGLHEIRTPSEGFAQTRQDFDFDFSSPWSAASPYSEVSQPSFYANLDDAIDDNTQDSKDDTNRLLIPRSPSSSLVRPPLPSWKRRRSFGSAGLLGFRIGEPRLIEVGLRRALMIPMIRGVGGSPMTATSFLTRIPHQGRSALFTEKSAASSKALELARRPATSQGQEAPLLEPDQDQVVMKRSASSGLLQDMLLVEAEDKSSKHDTDGVIRGSDRGRSGSLMFLIAGATLASQLMNIGK
jgi:hypothetical protein